MKLISKLKTYLYKFFVWYFRRKPIKRNKIILWADSFKHFGCSPKYIALYLLKRFPKKFDIVWVFQKGVSIPDDMPKEIRIVRFFSVKYLKEVHAAKFIICNARTSLAFMWRKRSEQIYIQTWHSSLRLKKIEKDVGENLGKDYIENAKIDSGMTDLLISGCGFSTQIFERAFWYNGEILNCGTPRCDILINGSETAKNKVFDFYKIDKRKKLLLYAPTFRNDKKAKLFGIDFCKLSEALKKKSGESWQCAYRFHPNIEQDFQDYNNLSMTDYPDMQEIICAADLLITDYSSCMFDMAIANKPCFLFVPDLDNYLSTERGLYFDIEKLPFPIARNMEELNSVLDKFDIENYGIKLEEFKNRIGTYEHGTACASVAEFIIGRM